MSNIRILKKLDGSVVVQRKLDLITPAPLEGWADDPSIPIVEEERGKSFGQILRNFYMEAPLGNQESVWEEIAQSFCSYLKSKGWQEPEGRKK